MAERIGLIGIGAMGGPMGQNLLKAGHSLVIYSRTRTRPEVERLVQAGATYVASPAGVGGSERLGDLAERLERKHSDQAADLGRIDFIPTARNRLIEGRERIAHAPFTGLRQRR